MTDIDPKYQAQILRIFYEEYKKKPSQTVSDIALTEYVKLPWEVTRQIIEDLEQQNYITVSRERKGIRIFCFFKITPEGINFVKNGSESCPSIPKSLHSKVIKILLLAANPTDTTRLRTDEEFRDIDLALRLAQFRDRFEIHHHGALRASDLQEYLLRHRPNIVHFSGHGDENSGGIVLENDSGHCQLVSVQSLTTLFAVLKDQIRCVFLNACYSKAQADAIAEHIDCVIGMSNLISERAAINFSIAFYRALGYGKDIKTAFDLGCNQIDLQSLQGNDTPRLIATHIDAERVRFV